MLGPLIFNVFLCDLFLFKPNINLVSYADYKTLFGMVGSSELRVWQKALLFGFGITV